MAIQDISLLLYTHRLGCDCLVFIIDLSNRADNAIFIFVSFFDVCS